MQSELGELKAQFLAAHPMDEDHSDDDHSVMTSLMLQLSEDVSDLKAQAEAAKQVQASSRLDDQLGGISKQIAALHQHLETDSSTKAVPAAMTAAQTEAEAKAAAQDKRDDAIAELEMKLAAFYAKHAPDKMSKIPEVAQAYWDDVETLDDGLRAKYNYGLDSVA